MSHCSGAVCMLREKLDWVGTPLLPIPHWHSQVSMLTLQHTPPQFYSWAITRFGEASLNHKSHPLRSWILRLLSILLVINPRFLPLAKMMSSIIIHSFYYYFFNYRWHNHEIYSSLESLKYCKGHTWDRTRRRRVFKHIIKICREKRICSTTTRLDWTRDAHQCHLCYHLAAVAIKLLWELSSRALMESKPLQSYYQS